MSAVGVVLSLPFLAAFCATAMPVAPTMTSQCVAPPPAQRALCEGRRGLRGVLALTEGRPHRNRTRPPVGNRLRRAARAGAYVYAALATCGAALYFCTCSNLGMAALAAYAVWCAGGSLSVRRMRGKIISWRHPH